MDEYSGIRKFIKGLKELNMEHGYKTLGEEPSREEIWTIKGYQDCMDDVISLFRGCFLIEEPEE